MEVLKVQYPIVAYAFVVTPDGDSFKELEKEVAADGGKIERVSDDAISLKIGTSQYHLPLGYVVVFDGPGEVKLLRQSEFEAKYYLPSEPEESDSENEAIVDLLERVASLEKTVKTLVDGVSRKPKAIKEKGENDE